MNDQPQNKAIELTTDYANHTINMKFSDNLNDDRERGYILSAAFFSFCAEQGLDKQAVIEMVSSHYDQFTGDNGVSPFKRL